MKVLITGALGQLGDQLQVTAPGDATLRAVDIDELDLADDAAVRGAVEAFGPEVIMNAAAYTAVDKAEEDEDAAFAVNRDGAYHLALAARAVGARLIHVSTDYVFDGCGCTPYGPDAATRPLGVYGRSKLAGEQKVQEALPGRSVIVRTAWLYSARGHNFLKTMLRLMGERDSIGVVADQVGTPTSAVSLAEALWRFVEKEALSGVYHFTDNGVASWYDFAVAIMEEAVSLGMLPGAIEVRPLMTADYPTAATRPCYSVLDLSKTRADLEMAGVHWRAALRRVLAEIEREN